MANTVFNSLGANIKVSLGTGGGVVGSTTSANNITLTSTATGRKKLAEMDDINDSVEVDGGTLVYDTSTQTYVLKALPIDGGTF